MLGDCNHLCSFYYLLKHLQSLEQELLQEAVSVPVYFATESEFLKDIYLDVQEGNAGDNAPTAWEGINCLYLCPSLNHFFFHFVHHSCLH